jgi:PAS domain-containing protein
VLAGLLGIPFNMLLMLAAGRPDWNIFTHQHNLAGAIASIIIGAAAGHIGSIAGRLRRELADRQKTDNSLHLLRAAVESLPIGITVVDTAGKTVYVNPAEAGMHGYRVEDLLGRDARVLAP